MVSSGTGLILATMLVLAAPIAAHAATAPDPGWSESGEASWYGPRHEGLRTTSGERFDSRKLTAAHPTLPLGTLVRVTLEGTGRSVIVRVNDREPPHGVRCIDLSKAAAARLGIVGRGVGDVTLAQVAAEDAVEVAEAPEPASPAFTRPRGRPHRRHARR